jgi:hypothetical protein
MVETVVTNRAGMGLAAEVAAHPLGRGALTPPPGGQAGAGVLAAVEAGMAKQGQCLGFCVLSIWAVHAAPLCGHMN